VWDSVYRLIREQAPVIRTFLQEATGSATRLILTGAGTSAFIGMSLAAEYRRQLKRHAVAVPTTDLVTHPVDHFFPEEHIMLISFARSGNSPESVAAVRLAERLAGRVHHLVFTCDRVGACHDHPARPGRVVVLPVEIMTGAWP
jgi:tagatose-6-phosphate ketose/aldose isomerase